MNITKLPSQQSQNDYKPTALIKRMVKQLGVVFFDMNFDQSMLKSGLSELSSAFVKQTFSK